MNPPLLLCTCFLARATWIVWKLLWLGVSVYAARGRVHSVAFYVMGWWVEHGAVVDADSAMVAFLACTVPPEGYAFSSESAKG